MNDVFLKINQNVLKNENILNPIEYSILWAICRDQAVSLKMVSESLERFYMTILDEDLIFAIDNLKDAGFLKCQEKLEIS